MVDVVKALAPAVTALVVSGGLIVLVFLAIRNRAAITRGPGGEITVRPDGSGRGGCPAIVDVLRYRERLRSVIFKIDYVQHVERPRDIMRVCDDQYDAISEYVMNQFRKYLEAEHGSRDGGDHQSYTHMEKCLVDIKEHVMRECRRMVHENNFLLKEASGEKEKYIDHQTQLLFGLLPARLNEIYRGQSPTREQVKAWARSSLDVVWMMGEIRKAVLFCFIASRTYQDRVDELEGELRTMEQDMVEKYIGGCS